MSSAAALPPPVNVSPFIRFSRWSLLAVGVVYGAYHQRRFAAKEAALRKYEAEQKPIRDAKLAVERKRKYDEEVKALEELSKPAKK